MSDGAETPGGHLLGIELNRTLGEAEPLLHSVGQLFDAAALLAQDVLGAGGHDDDLGPGRGHTDLDAGVTILGQLLGEEAVQFGLEHTIGHKLQTENAAFVGKF